MADDGSIERIDHNLFIGNVLVVALDSELKPTDNIPSCSAAAFTSIIDQAGLELTFQTCGM